GAGCASMMSPSSWTRPGDLAPTRSTKKPGRFGHFGPNGKDSTMDGWALLLVLVAAVLHAAWNLAAKQVGRGGAAFVFLYYTVSAAVCGPIALALLLTGSARPQWTWLVAALGTALLHIGYGIVLQRGYAVGDLSLVYPLAR